MWASVATRVESEPAARPSNGEAAPITRGRIRRRHSGPVSFPELVWAHFLWQREVHERGTLHGEAEKDFQRLLAAFERRHGQIQNAYWCTREASAVAITAQRPWGAIGRLLRIHPVVRFHAASHWVTRDLPDIAGLLYRCEAMSVKFTELLRHGDQQIAMESVLAIAGHLLGVADQTDAADQGRDETDRRSTRKGARPSSSATTSAPATRPGGSSTSGA